MGVLDRIRQSLSRFSSDAVESRKSRVMAATIAGMGLDGSKGGDLDEFGPNYRGPITNEMAARIYAAMPIARRAADIKAAYASSAPMNLYSRSGRGHQWRLEEGKFPAPMLEYVNPRMTKVSYISRLIYDLSIFENAYVAIEPSPVKDERISPLALWPMNPLWTTVVTSPTTGVKRYRYKVGAEEPVFFDFDKVIHIPGYSPFDDWYGLNSSNSLVYDIEKERYAKKFLANFYTKNVQLSGVLKMGSEGEEELLKYERQLAKGHAGADNAFKVLVLEKGMDYVPITSSQFEINSLPIIKDSTETAAMVYGVPLGLIRGDAQNTEDLELLLWNMTLIHLHDRIDQMHTKKLCMPISSNLKFAFNRQNVLALKKPLLNIARTHIAYANSDILTPNEVREELGKSPHSGDNKERGELTKAAWDAKYGKTPGGTPGGNPGQSGDSTPSMSLPGGGRDQSDGGEAQLLDPSGKKALMDLEIDDTEEYQKLLEMFG